MLQDRDKHARTHTLIHYNGYQSLKKKLMDQPFSAEGVTWLAFFKFEKYLAKHGKIHIYKIIR
jgi:hypothetical protein